jgi:hypothetical protein
LLVSNFLIDGNILRMSNLVFKLSLSGKEKSILGKSVLESIKRSFKSGISVNKAKWGDRSYWNSILFVSSSRPYVGFILLEWN